MSAAESIRDFLAPLLPGFALQYGRWVDDPIALSRRYAVLRPAGGSPAELVRRPQFTLTLVGPKGSDAASLGGAADTVIEAMRASAGDLVFMQPGEPAYFPTSDGRPVLEFAISAITN
jgi:hypothetical protein